MKQDTKQKETFTKQKPSETRDSSNRRDKSTSNERIVLLPRNNKNRSTRSKTEDSGDKYDQRERKFFPKDRTGPEKFGIIVITANGNNRDARLIEQEHDEAQIIPETQLSQNDGTKDVQESTEKKNFLFHIQSAVIKSKIIKNQKSKIKNNQSKIVLPPKILIYLAILYLKAK